MSRECVRFSSANNSSSQPNTVNGNSNDASQSQEALSQQTTTITLTNENNTPVKKPSSVTSSNKKSATPAKPKSPIVIEKTLQLKQENNLTINCDSQIQQPHQQLNIQQHPQQPQQINMSQQPQQPQQPQTSVNTLSNIKTELKNDPPKPVSQQQPTNDTTDEIIDSAVRQLAICDRILSIAQSHQITCSYTKLKREQLLDSANTSQKQLQLSVTCSNSEPPAEDIRRLEMWRCLCALIGPDILRIVEFAKRIPDFKSVQQQEQIILLKAHFFAVWLVRIACMLTSTSLTFESGYCISREQLELVYSSNFVARLIDFSKFLTALNLNDIEIGLIAAISITSTREIESLLDTGTKQQIDKTNKDLDEALQFEVRNRLRSDKANSDQQSVSQLCSQISSIIEQLHVLGHLHNQEINYFRQHVYKVKLPHILSEIYEIENGPSQSSSVEKMQEAELHQQPLVNISNKNGNIQYVSQPEMHQFSQSSEPLLNMQQQRNQYQIIHLNQNEFNNQNRLQNVNIGYQFKQESYQHAQSHEQMLLHSNQIN